MSSKQMVNVSEGICFRLANVVSLHVNHQYSVPTIYQRVSRTSIFE